MEFNKNTPQDEPDCHPEHTAYTQPTYYDQELPSPPALRVLLVGEFEHSFVDKNIYNYLRAEGFEVGELRHTAAFERIRWEQPTLVVLADDEAGSALMYRLQTDYLTQQIGIIRLASAAKTNSSGCNVITVNDFRQLTQAVERLRPRSEAAPLNLFQLQKLLIDPELRFFAEQVLDGLETLQLAALLGEDSGVMVNIETLVSAFGMLPLDAYNAIYKLAGTGFIEPLELETPDPLFALVAHPEKTALLQKFGRALVFKTYRTVLVTWLMACAAR